MAIRNDLLRDILSAIGGGGAVQWGSVGGNILDQTDLQAQFEDTTPNNVVEVNSESDFPAAAGGVITLAAKTYNIGDTITTANRFIVSDGTVIMGNSPFLSPLTYTGTGVMFTGSNANFAADFVLLSAPTGTLFDFTSTLGNGSTFGLNIVTVGACAKFGTFDNLRSINITNVNSFAVDDGITVSGSGNWERLAISRFGATTTKNDFIALDLSDSVLLSAEVDNLNVIGVPGAIGFSGLANSANITVGSVFSIASSEFLGGMTTLGGALTDNDTGFSYSVVSGVIASKALGHCYIITSQTTNITSGVEVGVAGIYTQGAESSQSTSSTTGVITLLNRIQKRGTVSTSIDIDKVGGGTDDYIFRIKKDVGGLGTTIENVDGAFTTISLSGGGSDSIYIFGPTRFVDGDEYFITVEGVGTNDDIVAVTQGFEVTE